MFHKKSKAFTLLLLIILSLTILTVNTRGVGENLKTCSLSILSCFQKVVSGTFRSTRDFLWGVFGRGHLVTENRRLELEIKALLEQISRLKEYKDENEELKQLLGFRQESRLGKASIGAEVIGRNPVNWYRTIVIDRGRKDGVEKDMVVVSGEGLVGKVKEVGRATSSVVLILDERSSVSAIIQRTREHGIVQGRLTDMLSMKYLSGKTGVVQGDVVRSSGLGGIYPKGLPIGTVTHVEGADFGLTKEAMIIPAVDFSRLENVLVVETGIK